MKQLVQQLRDGSMQILNVSAPTLGAGTILVQNHYSLISAGTEGGTVSAARKSLLGKAKDRPEQVKQVFDTLKQQGVVQTYRAVSKKLDSFSPLGYSSAGIVVDVGDDVRGFSVGDKVACAGQGYASHAEIVGVPENLCVKLSADADLLAAAYNTLGAIALQGVRQADLRVGETCVVIGLGLLGQLTCLLLRASGVRTIGLDIDGDAVELARTRCADHAFLVNDSKVPDSVSQLTNGINADAVIITAATQSTQPINLAGQILRKRGCVVVVGDVPTGFNREPDYYKKELSLRMSCSYGPGRYDLNYEEKGVDYPPGYVRWTENRNMQAFQQLLQSGQLDIGYMTTHRFRIDDARKAYDLIVQKQEDYLGIIIEYDASIQPTSEKVWCSHNATTDVRGSPGVSFIGAGSYAMSHLLPNLPPESDLCRRGILTTTGASSRSVAEKFGFAYTASETKDIVGDSQTSTVFVATRHDSHAGYVTEVLAAGKNVFVEKPLCLDYEELETILNAWQIHRPAVMVGFNRRFSPFAARLKDALGSTTPMSFVYRINSGSIPTESWIQDRSIGGGRIIGEVCHFVDLAIFLTNSVPRTVSACAMRDPSGTQDTLSINLSFENGSIGTICYFSNGPKDLPKEYLEVYCGGIAARLTDYRQLEIYSKKRPYRKKLLSQDKGQNTMVRRFLTAVKNGEESPISMDELIATTNTTFAIEESLRSRSVVELAGREYNTIEKAAIQT